MPPNPDRRLALADAGLAVLAADGARGLTHRAVDRRAGTPTGTCANYFPTRTALLEALGDRIFERLSPGDDELDRLAAAPPSHRQWHALMVDVVRRNLAQRELALALLELRLEATRHPELRRTLTATVGRGLEADLAFHERSRLAGGRTEVVLLHLAVGGLITELLTLPEALGIDDPEAVLATLVERLVPEGP